MEDKLFDNCIVNLIKEMSAPYTSSQRIREILKDNFSYICKKMHIGRIEVSYNIPIGIYNKTLKRENVVYYDDNNYDETLTEEQLVKTKYTGDITIISNPTKGFIWNDEEKEQILIFNKLLFYLCSQKKLEEIIDEASITDVLTGAPNIAKIMQLDGIQNNVTKYVSFFCNIKNFKYINQQVGMENGNHILRKFYNVMKSFLQEDEIIVRTGGDNFAGFIKKSRIDDFIEYVKIVNVVQECNSQLKRIELENRIGIYYVPKKEPLMMCIEKANIAMNFIKEVKSEYISYFDEKLENKIAHKKEVINHFKEGIKNNEFLVFYQPKVNAKNNTLVGCESLVRWNRNGKILSPDKFIPILESEGNICALDFFVLGKVLEDIRTTINMGLEPVKVSVNLSKKNLNNKHVADDILDIINNYNVPKKYIEIEITESACLDCYEELITFANKLRDNGVSVSIDDFGTGYSSLSLLKDINVDTIKIDKSFVDNVPGNNKDKTMLKNIVMMIKDLGFNIVVEGVENKAQINFLLENECEIIQGYYFDKPIPLKDFLTRVREKTYTEKNE